MTVLSFDDAIAEAEERPGNRHILLGNGFSIAYRPDLFTYGRLFDEANFDALSIDAGGLFAISGTSDFERAIEALRVSAQVLKLYPNVEKELMATIAADAEAVRAALAEVLASKHPENVGLIEDAEYASAKMFLSHFNGSIYSVNYDLLLYWTLLQHGGPDISNDDGFRTDPEDPEAEWVIWDGYAGHGQHIYYLHGGLHLYDAGSTLQKITWIRTGVPLVDQIRTALAQNVYPLVVTEGSSEEKLARIEHSPYLHKGLKSLQNNQGTIFIHGHSLAENDEHVVARIERSKVEHAYISLHGAPDSEANQAIRHRAMLMVERREANEAGKQERWRKQLEVKFYDADSAGVWTRDM
jgi:uncharacterized protein DUF4917